MLFIKTVAVAAALTPLASAHGGTGLPKILGLDLLDRRAESLISNLKAAGMIGAEAHGKSTLEARRDDRECGEGIGSCPKDKGCCSIAGCM